MGPSPPLPTLCAQTLKGQSELQTTDLHDGLTPESVEGGVLKKEASLTIFVFYSFVIGRLGAEKRAPVVCPKSVNFRRAPIFRGTPNFGTFSAWRTGMTRRDGTGRCAPI
jgi:hypothetical protein